MRKAGIESMGVTVAVRAEDPVGEEPCRLKWDPEAERFVIGECEIHCGCMARLEFCGKWHLACFEHDGRRPGTGWYVLMHGRAFAAEEWLGARSLFGDEEYARGIRP